MTTVDHHSAKPLNGVRVLELAGLGPVPYAGQLLADMGAEVISVARKGQPSHPVEDRGKRSLVLNLKNPTAKDAILKLVEQVDVLIEGYRPGVTERLGIGPSECLQRSPGLVYGRMTGWGQQGPWSQMAGHDINYIGLTGVLNAMGKEGQVPQPPLNLVGDYGGGSLFLVSGVLAALVSAQTSGKGRVLDVAMVDGSLSMFGLMLSMHAEGAWSTTRSSNMLDGSAPFYRCYRCSDDRFMAVGALEPVFFKKMLELLDIDAADYGEQYDKKQYTQQNALLESTFATKSRDSWAKIFDGSDACVTPVLDYVEARDHPHMKARNALIEHNNVLHPNIAPRFSGLDFSPPQTPSRGMHTRELLEELNLPNDVIDTLLEDA